MKTLNKEVEENEIKLQFLHHEEEDESGYPSDNAEHECQLGIACDEQSKNREATHHHHKESDQTFLGYTFDGHFVFH